MPDTASDNVPDMSGQGVNLSTAAAVLGVSTRTVRRWLHSGKLHGEKVGAGRGRWVVYLDNVSDNVSDMSGHVSDTGVEVERLRSEVAYLRDRLDAAEAEKRALFVTVERLTRALPAPEPVPGERVEGERRSWWRRWFG